MTKAETREALVVEIANWASHDVIERLRDGGKYLLPAIDAFERAAVAESVGPAILLLEGWVRDFRKAGGASERVTGALDLLRKAIG